jgi:DNA-binding response OmpR family regulator
MSAPRILIVEDDAAIRGSIDYALAREGYVTKVLESGSGALETISRFKPDLIILDLMLPGMTGLDIAEAVRAHDRATAIIMISALDEERDIITGLALGADDYVTKPFSTDELFARVEANLRRVRGPQPDEAASIEIGDLCLDPVSSTAYVAGEALSLRPKEFGLLSVLARNADALMTRDVLAHEVWGYDHLPSSRTIDVHIQRLRAALEEVSEHHYIHTVHGSGYRFTPERIEVSQR